MQIPNEWRQTNESEEVKCTSSLSSLFGCRVEKVMQSVFEGSAVCVVTDSVMRVPSVG